MSPSPSPDHHREVSQKQLEWWERELILAHSFKGNSLEMAGRAAL